MKYVSRSQSDTIGIAGKIAAKLKGGETLALTGDLGAGKTAFTKGLAKALGVKKSVSSPTFVLMKVYPVKHPHITTLVHVDAYRIVDAESLKGIGLADYITDPNSVVVIEWADRVKKIIPRGAMHIGFGHRGDDERLIVVASGKRAKRKQGPRS